MENILLEADKENYTEADFMSKRFVNAETRNRAYINVLGSELFIKYLADNGIKTDDIISLHSISKILENIDIADVLLPNIHIDVRTVFDENKIFIPKSHSEYGIKPDIYVVLKLSKNFKEAEILGYFKPSQINKNNENKDYYFFSKEKLYSPDTLIEKISGFKGEKDEKLGTNEFLRGRTLSVGYSDHSLSKDELKEFYKLMYADPMLRDSVAEFDNFEVLSSRVASVLSERIEIHENSAKEIPGIAVLTTEEILKEGVNALIDQKTAEVEDVFEEAEAAAEVIEDTSKATANAEDIFEATEDVVTAQMAEDEKEYAENHKMTEIEILPADEHEQDAEKTLQEDAEELSGEADFEISEEQTEQEDITIEEPQQEETEIDTLQSADIEAAVTEDTIEDNSLTSEIGDTAEIKEEDLQIGDIDDEIQTEEEIRIDEPGTFEAADDEIKIAGSENSEVSDNDFNISEESLTDIRNMTPVQDMNTNVTDAKSALVLSDDLTLEPLPDPEAEIMHPQPVVKPRVTIDEVSALKPEMSIDTILDNAIAAIDAADNVKSTIDPKKAVSDAAIKMASVAGGAIEKAAADSLKQQNEPILHKDMDVIHEEYSAETSPEQAALVGGLAGAKMQANMQAEKEGLAEITDITELETVEPEKQENIIHKVVDIDQMKTVEREQIVEDNSAIVELDKIESVDSPTRSTGDFDPLAELDISDAETMELPDLNSYTINDDGTSPADNMNWGEVAETEKGGLLDFDSAEFLTGDNFPEPTEEDTEDLIDGTMFKAPDMLFNLDELAAEPEITGTRQETSDTAEFEISEDLSSGCEAGGSIEDFPIDEITEAMPEESAESTNTEELSVEITEPIDEIKMTAESSDEIQQEIDHAGMPDKKEEENTANEIFEISEESAETIADNEIISDTAADAAELNPQGITPEGVTSEILEDTMPEEDYTKQAAVAAEQVEASAETEQDWTEDTGFDSLADVDIPTGNDFISEPDTISAPVFKAKSNSTVISSKNFKPGEINIDINKQEIIPPEVSNNSINNLFDDNSHTGADTILQNPGRLTKKAGQPGKGLIMGLGITGVVVVLVLLFSLGFGISRMLKPQTEETPQPVTDDAGIPADNGINTASGEVLEMNNNTNALASTTGTDTSKKTNFVEVKKLSWEVPGAVSAEPAFREYFQSAGKSIKSALMTDLLSVTDIAYASEMRVSVTLTQDGTFREARIVTSSGSNQIDNIVLRTVNQTLNVLKAPHSVGSYENTTAVLKIYL